MVTPSTNPFQRSRPDENRLGTIVGIELLTGEILWKHEGWNCHMSVAPAADAGEGRVLVVVGYELAAKMIQIEKRAAGNYGATELFTTEEFGDQTRRPILHDGFFYAQYGINNRRDGRVCMGMDGEINQQPGRGRP